MGIRASFGLESAMGEPLPLVSINHLAREVADVERSVDFYENLLGFRPIKRPGFDFRGSWLFGFGVQLHLIEGRSKEGVVEISSRVDHVAFHTDDPDAVQARLEELGIQYLRNVQGPTGVIQIFFHDPDGNHIEVATYPVHPDVDSSAMLR